VRTEPPAIMRLPTNILDLRLGVYVSLISIFVLSL
jgi:hypothetical protein